MPLTAVLISIVVIKASLTAAKLSLGDGIGRCMYIRVRICVFVVRFGEAIKHVFVFVRATAVRHVRTVASVDICKTYVAFLKGPLTIGSTLLLR